MEIVERQQLKRDETWAGQMRTCVVAERRAGRSGVSGLGGLEDGSIDRCRARPRSLKLPSRQHRHRSAFQ